MANSKVTVGASCAGCWHVFTFHPAERPGIMNYPETAEFALCLQPCCLWSFGSDVASVRVRRGWSALTLDYNQILHRQKLPKQMGLNAKLCSLCLFLALCLEESVFKKSMMERRAGAVFFFLTCFLLSNKARGGTQAATQQYTISIIIIIGGEHLLCHLSETIVTVLNPCIYCIKCCDNAWLEATQWNLILKPNVLVSFRLLRCRSNSLVKLLHGIWRQKAPMVSDANWIWLASNQRSSSTCLNLMSFWSPAHLTAALWLRSHWKHLEYKLSTFLNLGEIDWQNRKI